MRSITSIKVELKKELRDACVRQFRTEEGASVKQRIEDHYRSQVSDLLGKEVESMLDIILDVDTMEIKVTPKPEHDVRFRKIVFGTSTSPPKPLMKKLREVFYGN